MHASIYSPKSNHVCRVAKAAAAVPTKTLEAVRRRYAALEVRCIDFHFM